MITKTESNQPTRLPVALVAESIAGLVLGALTAVLVGIACVLVLHWTGLDNQLGMGSLGVTLYAGLLGFAIGAAVGVALVGRWLHQGGSFWLALTGAMLALILITVLVRRGLFSYSEMQLAIPAIISLALAVLGYNLQRRSPG
jgi:hypothetical protein